MGNRSARAQLAAAGVPGLLVLLGGSCAVLVAWDRIAGLLGLAAGICGLLAVVLRRRSLRAGDETLIWGRFGRAVLRLGLGFGVALGLHALAPQSTGGAALGIAVGVVGAVPPIYQGLVHWNRYRTAFSDPGDWLNGVGSVIVLMAVGTILIIRTDSPLGSLPAWELQVGLLQYAALFMLTGTASTILVIGGLARDARALVVATGLGVALVAQSALAAGVAAVPGSGELDRPLLVATVGASWLLVAGVLAIACRLPVPRFAPREATPEVANSGAVVVLAAAVVTLLVNAVFPVPELRWSSVLAALGALIAGVRVLRLVSELAQAALSRKEARTDDLTGIANRRRFTEILVAPPVGGERALVLVNLGRFKEVNDRFGHEVGDQVLTAVARRVESRVGLRGTVARLGGDEFALVLDSRTREGAREVADELLAAVREPVDVAGVRVRVDASIGVAYARVSGGIDGELMRSADEAMCAAKRAGGGVFLFDEVAYANAQAERQLAEDLGVVLTTDSLEAGELVVHYQPQVRAGSGALVGVEALVRWQHPTRGLIQPLTFLPLAERAGWMHLVTEQVLDQAVAEVVGWFPKESEVRLSVNLSSSCLAAPTIVDMIDATLARHGMPSRRLVVEVTETSIMEDVALATEVTRALAARGIGVSIDDFGTGYSSLARLNVLPADELKLDRSFTMQIAADARTAAIVGGTVDFAHRLGLRVVAEGVEDVAALEVLRALGCDVSQGFLHSRPLPADEMRVWCAGHLTAAH